MLQNHITAGQTNTGMIAKIAGTIARQADRLDKLIGELLDVTRLQRGQFALNPEPLDFAELVARIVEETSLGLSESVSHPTISLLLHEESVPVRGDQFRLEAVVQNLVNNAIKYSPNGGTVLVRVGCQDGEASLEITDQGIGIPQEAQAHLFEPFFRAGNVGSRTSGFGMGLYIVHEIVVRHGGRIAVSSIEGQGSTFRVTLPLRSPDQ
jgi:signal transduction histidine kinase